MFRASSQYLQYKARTRSVEDDIGVYVNTIDKDGVTKIEEFLSRAQFDEVSAEYEDILKGVELRPYKQESNSRLFRKQITLSDATHNGSKILENFQNNDRLNRIASAVVRRTVSHPPKVHLDWYQSLHLTGTDYDVENILHADLHTATVKMFFFLNDTDETNGAFIYAKGTHRLTLDRLRHEYDLSVRQAKLKNGMPLDGSLVETRGSEVRNLIQPKYRQAMKVEETHMCVRANTLVIANNMGFHRRGEFSSDRPRKAVQVNFRYLERPFGKGLFKHQNG